MHRVTIKPENGRVEALKAHSRASSAVENSRNMHTWFNPDAYTRRDDERYTAREAVFFFLFFYTKSRRRERIPDLVCGYLFNWPRCASSNNTCYALKLERVYFRGRSRLSPFPGRFTPNDRPFRISRASPPIQLETRTRYTLSDYWNVDQATVRLMFVEFSLLLGKRLLEISRGWFVTSILEIVGALKLSGSAAFQFSFRTRFYYYRRNFQSLILTWIS